jgi:phosphomannomutase
MNSPATAVLDLHRPHAVKAVVFDLDDTLAPSKEPVTAAMGSALCSLLQRLPVCIISGGLFRQIRLQVLDRLPATEGLLARLHVMPTCGTRSYVHRDGAWAVVHTEDLATEQVDHIRQVLETSARSLGLWQPTGWGDLIEDRGGQVTFSGLGQTAPAEAKHAWDPDGGRRSDLLALVAAGLPGFEVRSGGSTSVDVTRAGVDKGYGIRRLLGLLDATEQELVFVGDRLDQDGNDHPVLALGVPCVAVSGWEDTLTVIARFEQWWDGRTPVPAFRLAPAGPPATARIRLR